MTAVEVLRAARERISDPDHWIKGVFAKAPDGQTVHWDSVDACAWCSSGAVKAAAAWIAADDDALESEAYWVALELLTEYMDGSITSFNDSAQHADVLAAFDDAIVLAERRTA